MFIAKAYHKCRLNIVQKDGRMLYLRNKHNLLYLHEGTCYDAGNKMIVKYPFIYYLNLSLFSTYIRYVFMQKKYDNFSRQIGNRIFVFTCIIQNKSCVIQILSFISIIRRLCYFFHVFSYFCFLRINFNFHFI